MDNQNKVREGGREGRREGRKEEGKKEEIQERGIVHYQCIVNMQCKFLTSS
jgi:ribosomal protein L37AE/L43A